MGDDQPISNDHMYNSFILVIINQLLVQITVFTSSNIDSDISSISCSNSYDASDAGGTDLLAHNV